jgi:hypothetical protein
LSRPKPTRVVELTEEEEEEEDPITWNKHIVLKERELLKN